MMTSILVTTIISVSCTWLEQVFQNIYISERMLYIMLIQSGNAPIWKYPRSHLAVCAMAIWPTGKVRVRLKLRRRRQKRRNGNTTTLLKTVDLNYKIGSLLEGTTYRRLVMNTIELVESKTTFLLKKSTLSDELRKRLRPPRLY